MTHFTPITVQQKAYILLYSVWNTDLFEKSMFYIILY